MSLLRRTELRTASFQPTLALGYLHALARSCAEQIDLELSDHRQDVEKQPADGVVRIMHGSAKAQSDAPISQLSGNVTSVRNRP